MTAKVVLDEASDIKTNASIFNKNLSPADSTVQKALEKLDQLVLGGVDLVSFTYFGGL